MWCMQLMGRRCHMRGSATCSMCICSGPPWQVIKGLDHMAESADELRATAEFILGLMGHSPLTYIAADDGDGADGDDY